MINYRTLFEISKLLVAEQEVEKLLALAMDKVIESAKAQRGMILVAGENGEIQFETARNFKKEDLVTPQFEISRTIIDKVLETGEPVLLQNALDHADFNKSQSITQLNILSVACVPLIDEATPFGAIYIDNRKLTAVFSEETKALLLEFTDLISAAVKNALEQRRLLEQQRKLSGEIAEIKGFGKIIGSNKALRDILQLVGEVADTNATILISGETGTGKELIARALHQQSFRRDREFVALNCAALPESLIESELFGHEKGAFTGAGQRKIGWLEAAHGGTLFLDEIGELPLLMQVKFLRFLQTGEFSRVGSTKALKSDARIVAATNRDLGEMVSEGAFRQDLYFRLNILEMRMPPLRERGADVVEIAEHFLARYRKQFRKESLRIGDHGREYLLQYAFPGNVRELENMIQRAILLARGHEINRAELQPLPGAPAASEWDFTNTRQFKEAKDGLIEKFEKIFLKKRLEETSGNISAAARNSGMYKANFIQKMNRYGIKRKQFLKD